MSRSRHNIWRHRPMDEAGDLRNVPGYFALYDDDDKILFRGKTNKLKSALLSKHTEFTYFSAMKIPWKQVRRFQDVERVVTRLAIDENGDESGSVCDDVELVIEELLPEAELVEALHSAYTQNDNMMFPDMFDEIIERFNYTRHYPSLCNNCIKRGFCIRLDSLRTKHWWAYPIDIGSCDIRDTGHKDIKCPVCKKPKPNVIIVNRDNNTHKYEMWCSNCSWNQELPFKWGCMELDEEFLRRSDDLEMLLVDLVLGGEQKCDVLLDAVEYKFADSDTKSRLIQRLESWIKKNIRHGTLSWEPNHHNGDGRYRGLVKLVESPPVVRENGVMLGYHDIDPEMRREVDEFVRATLQDREYLSYQDVIKLVKERYRVKMRRSVISEMMSRQE